MPLSTIPARVGRPTRPVAASNDWRDDALALLHEREDDARRMRNVLPMIRFVRAVSEDAAQERAAGIIQLEVERIARRGGDAA